MAQQTSKPRRCSRLVIFSGLALMCGCSTFDKDWKVAVDSWQPAGHTDITGPWQGTWQSEANTHSGGLRCLITRSGENAYHARFAATYWKIFHFGYEMDLAADPHLDQVHFDGSADLGWLAGGAYRYDGHSNSTDFYCTYHSQHDHGNFTMKRPEEQ
jgi:hypothetical protein